MPSSLETLESPVGSSGLVDLSVSSRWGSLSPITKFPYLDGGLIFLLYFLRVGLLVGVGGSFGSRWSEFSKLPPVVPGSPRASPDATKSTIGTVLSIVGGEGPGAAASPSV